MPAALPNIYYKAYTEPDNDERIRIHTSRSFLKTMEKNANAY